MRHRLSYCQPKYITWLGVSQDLSIEVRLNPKQKWSYEVRAGNIVALQWKSTYVKISHKKFEDIFKKVDE